MTYVHISTKMYYILISTSLVEFTLFTLD